MNPAYTLAFLQCFFQNL